MQEIINKILSIAINAPSGDNSQPWEFRIRDSGFDILNLPNRDNPIFNFMQRGSYIAHGALIQNIKLLAPLYGYEAIISLFPEKHDLNKIATITLQKTAILPATSEIQEIIKTRSTNRKKYESGFLTAEQKQALLTEASKITSGKFILLEDKDKKKKIATASSSAERIMLQYQPLHEAFFSIIRWDKKEEKKLGYGMLIDTLELAPPQKIFFKWFSNWRASTFLRKIGMPNFIAKENAKSYESASAIGAIIMNDLDPESLINTGRILQSVWLKATELALSIQPIAGILYLNQRLQGEGIPNMPENLQMLIKNSGQIIKESLDIGQGQYLTMIFRIGFSTAPSAKSSKFLHIAK